MSLEMAIPFVLLALTILMNITLGILLWLALRDLNLKIRIYTHLIENREHFVMYPNLHKDEK